MQIRSATIKDASFIAELTNELGYQGTCEQIANRMTKIFSAGDLIFLAEVDKQVAGMICYSSRPRLGADQDIGRITSLIVKSTFRRRGIGQSLVKFIENLAQELKHESIELTTKIQRKEAHEFYLKLNYLETSKKFTKKLPK